MLDQYAIIKAIQEITSKPNKTFSVRGLASSAKISPGACKIALASMTKQNLVSFSVIGKSHQYKANLDNALCKQWKILFNLNELNEAKILEQIKKEISNVQAVLLYGSFAKGTNDEKSDVDLLVIAFNPKKISFAGKLKKEINLIAFSPSEWKKKALQNKVFYENIIYDSIVLFGARPVIL